MTEQFDLIIVGAGSGNMIPGPDHDDWKIALVEKDRFGGTCLNRGCIPSKMLIHSAEVAETMHTAETFGIKATIESIDWHRVIGRVWQRIDPVAEAGERWRSSRPNTTVYKGGARFVGEKVLEVDGRRISAPRIVLGAGSRPRLPAIQGLDQVPYHTSDTIMRLPKQPKSLVILGGGYISAELGHFFGALGTEVTIIQRGDRLLSGEDADISQRFTDVYSRRFNVLLHTRVAGVRQQQGSIRLDLRGAGAPQQVEGEALLIAVGRIPNTDLLEVAKTGVTVDGQGRIVTNEYYETNVPGIWALGDISNPHQLKHAANADARVVAYNVAHPATPRQRDDYAMPHAVFASPQVASVGLTELQVRAQGLPYLVGKRDFRDAAYGWAIEDTESFAKVMAHAETRQVLGAHIIGPHASILLQPLINAMRFGETIDQLAHETFYIHPSLPEVIEQAVLEMD